MWEAERWDEDFFFEAIRNSVHAMPRFLLASVSVRPPAVKNDTATSASCLPLCASTLYNLHFDLHILGLGKTTTKRKKEGSPFLLLKVPHSHENFSSSSSKIFHFLFLVFVKIFIFFRSTHFPKKEKVNRKLKKGI